MGRLARPGLVGSFAIGALVVFVIVGVALWLFVSAVGDAERVRQVLTNLVINAIKFTSQGLVSIRARLADGMVEISVEDTGIGIAPGADRFIFDGFRQADGSVTRKFGGAGLGLATARKLVELQGGRIGVESREDKGSRFWFTLRAADGDAPKPASEGGLVSVS